MSNNNDFFKPTLLYKEFMILDLIEKNAHVTQREMAASIGVAVSMVNGYVTEYEKKGLIKRKKHSTKTVEYFVTKKGMERKKVVNIGYLESTLMLYNNALDGLVGSLIDIEKKGFKKVLLYGAGEVASMLVYAISKSQLIDIELLGIIDDNPDKMDHEIDGYKIVSRNMIDQYDYDGILVSSYIHQNKIYNILKTMKIDLSKVIIFF